MPLPPLPPGASARCEGAVAIDGDALVFGASAGALVIQCALPAGAYRIAIAVSSAAAIRLEIVAGGRPVPLPLREVADGLIGDFGLDSPLEALRIMPVEDGRVLVRRFEIVPRTPSTALLPPWRIGGVQIPPLGADAPVVRDEPTPEGWAGCRLLARQGITLAGQAMTVGPGGVLLLALDPPRAGWWRCEAELTDADGGAAPVEPRVAAHPVTPLDGSILRPAGGNLYCAQLRVGDDGHVLFRPRTERGTVIVRRLRFRPVAPGEAVERLARPLRQSLAGATSQLLGAAPRVRRASPAPPPPTFDRISVVVATRDAPHHLARFLSTLTATAPAVELVLVDNGSRDEAALALLAGAERRGARVLRDDRPFNFAALANLGARASTGEALVFANNDIVFTRRGWLEHLLAPLAAPDIGITGARLLYPDGRIQHGGVVLAGEARVRHAERFMPWWRAGYGGRQRITVSATAVTGALLATRRTVFEAVGGFDAGRYGVLYNDVDFCLRVAQKRLGVLYVPAAEAVHAESVTIGAPQSADPFGRGGRVWRMMRSVEADNFRVDWAGIADRDPCYPQMFDPVAAAFRPRRRGW